jgi:predicted PurR-regulated permease PerM
MIESEFVFAAANLFIAIAALVVAVFGVIVALLVGIATIVIAVAQLLVSLYPHFRQDKLAPEVIAEQNSLSSESTLNHTSENLHPEAGTPNTASSSYTAAAGAIVLDGGFDNRVRQRLAERVRLG